MSGTLISGNITTKVNSAVVVSGFLGNGGIFAAPAAGEYAIVQVYLHSGGVATLKVGSAIIYNGSTASPIFIQNIYVPPGVQLNTTGNTGLIEVSGATFINNP